MGNHGLDSGFSASLDLGSLGDMDLQGYLGGFFELGYVDVRM